MLFVVVFLIKKLLLKLKIEDKNRTALANTQIKVIIYYFRKEVDN